MDMNRIVRKRAASLVLALLMAISCTFNTAAADSGSTDYVDSQSANSAQRVYDSGNVVLSNEVVPVKENTYQVKLSIDIHDIDKFLLKDSSVLIDGETDDSVSSSSGVQQKETKDSGTAASASAADTEKADGSAPQTKGAAGSAAETGAAVLQSASVSKLAFAISDYPAIASRALANPESEGDLPDPDLGTYEVRYYIEKGFNVLQSSIPSNARRIDDDSGLYVYWRNLSLNDLSKFTNSVIMVADQNQVKTPKQKSGIYHQGSFLAEFPNITLPSYYYVPVNLYKYNRESVSKTDTTMKINQASLQAARNAVQKYPGEKIRGLSFDKVTNPGDVFNGSWNTYQGQNGRIFEGIVGDELDTNGNLQWGEGTDYKYAGANLFGPKDAATSAYREDHTNVAFPLQKGADGSYSFNSDELRGVYNGKDRIIPCKQDISPDTGSFWNRVQNALFSPFYSSAGNPTDQNRNQTYSFGMNMNIQFTMPEGGNLAVNKPMTFEFSGDDDVWIFIDKKLVLDIGGIHQQKNGTINFASGDATTTDLDGTVVGTHNIYDDIGISSVTGELHTLSMFYLERGAGYSNFKMKCNLLQYSAFEIGKKLEGLNGDETFRFKAEADGNPLNEVPFNIYNVNGTSTGEVGRTTADGTFYLHAGQKAVFSYSYNAVKNIIGNSGSEIRVSEQEAENYQTDYTVTADGHSETTPNRQNAVISVPGPRASPQTVNLTFTNKPGPGRLTINKKVTRAQGSDEQNANADTAQFFTFKIEQYASDADDDDIRNSTITPLSTSYEVIYTTGGAGSKRIVNLPWGKYRITEIPNSAWRYTPEDPESQVISVGERNPEVNFQNYLSNENWVSGKDSVTNVFKPKSVS